MTQAFICDAIRTPFGLCGGALSSVRTDELAAIPLSALMARNPGVDWAAVTDVIYGCATQAGEDNRNVAHMARLLAGLPLEMPGGTINRLCGSSPDAVGTAARAIKSGEATLMIASGVESMGYFRNEKWSLPSWQRCFGRYKSNEASRQQRFSGARPLPATNRSPGHRICVARKLRSRLVFLATVAAVPQPEMSYIGG